MSWKHCIACLLLSLAGQGTAWAQLRASVGGEYYGWTEETTPEVSERGGLAVFGLEYTKPGVSGLLWGYRGNVYTGAATYDGSSLRTPTTPVTGTTSYVGMSHEGRLHYRFDVGNQRGVDLVFGAGVDIWQRRLSSVQREDYLIGFFRLGVETERNGAGWIGGGGIKMPFHTWEDAHLTDIGFGQNPTLQPGKRPSFYAQLGYRFDSPMSLIFYVDSYRFSQSKGEVVDDLTQSTKVEVYQPASNRYSIGLRLRFEFE